MRCLPRELRDFLLAGDGAEGWFAGAYVAVWPVEQLVAGNRDELRSRFPYLLLFGSDGSREYLALDLRYEPAPVVMLDMTSTSPEGFVRQAPSLDALLVQLPQGGLVFE